MSNLLDEILGLYYQVPLFSQADGRELFRAVEIIETKGTKKRGGGKGGESWEIRFNKERAGIVFINLISDRPRGQHASIQIFLNKKSVGMGIGRCAYLKACLMSQYKEIYAHMRKSNKASIKAAYYAGFVEASTPEDIQLTMRWIRKER